ncbi:hypothetical protein AB0I00_35040 [Streptomyces sp. NPDC050803]|uniref:hypothetical protein n=1 Tax=unclassified Streptomyces TaxID=2593676 RepID=UPI00343F0382
MRARVSDHPRPGAWWLRIDWTRWGAVVGVVAGIGTLLFTGVATYYGARVSADQLAQSRESAERQSRDQATRISFWIDRTPTGEARVHLMNRSPDPVTGVVLDFSVEVARPNSQIVVRDRVSFSVELLSAPPCSEMVFDEREMKYKDDGMEDWTELPDPILAINVEFVFFTDRDGVLWARGSRTLTSSGVQALLDGDRRDEEPHEEASPWSPPRIGGSGREIQGWFEGEPAIKRAASCAADAS